MMMKFVFLLLTTLLVGTCLSVPSNYHRYSSCKSNIQLNLDWTHARLFLSSLDNRNAHAMYGSGIHKYQTIIIILDGYNVGLGIYHLQLYFR